MQLSRRQTLQLAAFGLLQVSALAQGQESPYRYFGGFQNDPTGEKHDTTRWPVFSLLGVLCTVTWKQSPTDKWTWFRGLKQGYAVGKNVLLKDEWQDLWVIGGRRLFGRLFGADKTIWEIPLARKGKDLKLGKPVATTYTSFSLGSTCCGLKQEGTLDWFDTDGEVVVTLHNILTPPRRYGSVYCADFRDPSGLTVLGMLDDRGQLVSPLLPDVKSFIYTKSRSDGGWSEYPLLAVPLDASKNRFLPINPQGQVPAEALTVRGYYPNTLAFPATGEPKPLTSGPVLWQGWLKEYELEDGLAYGWVSEDLKTETGIVWRSIRYFGQDTTGMVGQLMDGTWMVYVFAAPNLRSAGHPYHQPLLDAPTATREEALKQFAPAYQEKIAKPREEARLAAERAEQERLRLYWEQRSKDNIALLIAHGYKPGQGSESPAELQRIAEGLRDIRTAIELRQYRDYQQALSKLPVDWQIRYVLSGGKSAFGESYGLTPEIAENYAKSARDPKLAQELRERAVTLREQEAERKKQAERAAAELKKRQAEWAKQGNPTAPRAPSGHVYTAPSSASWVYKPQPTAPASPGLGQYMRDLYEYGRGRDWKPVYR